jgi:hypothetical protein
MVKGTIVTEADIRLQNELDAVIEARIRERRHRKIAGLMRILKLSFFAMAIMLLLTFYVPLNDVRQFVVDQAPCNNVSCWEADPKQNSFRTVPLEYIEPKTVSTIIYRAAPLNSIDKQRSRPMRLPYDKWILSPPPEDPCKHMYGERCRWRLDE